MQTPQTFNSTEAYFGAVIPRPVNILGLDLKPFCAGHIVLLHTVQSAFVVPKLKITDAQFATALALCSFTFEEGIAWLREPKKKIDREMRDWRRAVGAFDLAAATEQFLEYVENGSRFPMKYVSKESGAASISDLPRVQIIRCALRHYYHLNDAEFWNMPWGLAQWDYFTAPVLEGKGDVCNPAHLLNAVRAGESLAERLVILRKRNPNYFDKNGGLKPEGREALKGIPCRN